MHVSFNLESKGLEIPRYNCTVDDQNLKVSANVSSGYIYHDGLHLVCQMKLLKLHQRNLEVHWKKVVRNIEADVGPSREV